MLCLGSVCILAGCAKNLNTDDKAAGISTGPGSTNTIVFQHSREYTTNPGASRPHTFQTTWHMTGHLRGGAFGEPIHTGDVVEWCNKEGTNFSIVVPSTGDVKWTLVDQGATWDAKLPRRFDPATYQGKNATPEDGNLIVRLRVDWSKAVPADYTIVVPPVMAQAKPDSPAPLTVPYDYYMVDATLVWDTTQAQSQ